jgi:translation initiation factor IF-2
LRKVRVYQLARELKVTNEDILELLVQLGTPVRNHASSVDNEVADQVRSHLAGPKRAGKEVPVPVAAKTSEASATTTATPAEKTVVRTRPQRQASAKTASKPEPALIWGNTMLPQAPMVAALDLSPLKPAPVSTPPARYIGPALAMLEVITPPKRPEHKETRRRRPDDGYRSSDRSQGAPQRGGAGKPGGFGNLATMMPDQAGGKPAGGRGGGPGVKGPGGKKGKRKKKRREVDERELLDSVRRTMASMEGGRVRKKKKVRQEDGTEIEEEVTTIRINEFATVSELAASIGVRPAEVVATCLRLGVVANINRRLDRDTIGAIALEFDYEVEFIKEFGEELIEEIDETASDVPEVPRPAIVTVMGHVDHGKTKLLDYIRKTDVVAGESGGITQHIGAYQAHMADGRLVTFLDTPGHQAFTAMRARGADVTDIVILIVAADDKVNEQTVEAINHAKAARKPIVVAINKCDLPTAEPEKIKQQLAEQGLQVEDWGGDVVSVEISAKFGQGIDKLMEMVLLIADMNDFKAQADRFAKATVIEARKDPFRGIVATVLIQSGTLEVSSYFICGVASGKVRAMTNERGEKMVSAGPSTPVEITGWSEVPQTGDIFTGVKTEAMAKKIAGERSLIAREKRMRLASNRFRLGELHTRLQEQQRIDLRVIIKADVQGSVEVLRDSLTKLSDEQVSVVVIHTGVGQINESDVLLATASRAVIVGFHVRPDPRAIQLAQVEDVEIRLYKIIYEAIEEITAAKAGLLKPTEEERVLGTAEVRDVFSVTKVGTVAGCNVVAGTVTRSAQARLIRGADIIWTGKISSLKRFKDDVKEVATGFDCGIMLEGQNDIAVKDQIEAFVIEEVAATAAK